MSNYPFVSPGTYSGLSTYGSILLTETSPQQTFVEPLTLSEVKSYVKVPERSPADEAEDDELRLLITAAREQAEILQGCDLVQKQWDITYDYWPSYRVELRTPLIKVDLVQYRDKDGNFAVLTEATNYIIDISGGSGIITPPYFVQWPSFTPWPASAILIRFTSGYPLNHAWWSGPGARVKVGMKLLVSHWYNNRLIFDKGKGVAEEFPYSVTSCLTYGALARAR